MPDLETSDLLNDLVAACQSCVLVESYLIATSDEDTLDVRVMLKDQSFIHVYYNLPIGKVAFAWIRGSKRIYGKANVRKKWHKHPPEAIDQHVPCEPVDLATFLSEVEQYWRQFQQKSS